MKQKGLTKLTDVAGFIEQVFQNTVLYDKDPAIRANKILKTWRKSRESQEVVKYIFNQGCGVRRVLSEVFDAVSEEEEPVEKEVLRKKMDKLRPYMKIQEKQEVYDDVIDALLEILQNREMLEIIRKLTFMETRNW